MDTMKSEIKELIELTRYLERFDAIMYSASISPTQEAADIRQQSEIRYVELLEKYTK